MKLNKEIKNPKWKLYFKHEPNNIDCKHWHMSATAYKAGFTGIQTK